MAIELKDSESQMKGFSRIVYWRMHRAGAHDVSVEDVYNELVIAWCQARDAFDPEKGASFKTFLYRGMQHHINRWAQRHIRSSAMCAFSLDESFGSEGDEDDMHAVIHDAEAIDAEEVVERADTKRKRLARLSEPARKVVELMANPPDEIEEELRALAGKKEWAQELGLTCSLRTIMSMKIAFDVLGMGQRERAAVSREIERAAVRA